MNDTQLSPEQQLKLSLAESEVPAHLHGGIVRYIVSGVPLGGFLRAVFSNDLILAVCRADDDIALEELRALVRWVYNEAPSPCHGSHDAVASWLKAKEKEFGVR